MTGPAERVLGIGGLFLRGSAAVGPDDLAGWYRDVLGLDLGEHGIWQQEEGPTVVAAFDADSDYLGSAQQRMMLNFRVRDLDAMLAQVRAAAADRGGEVVDDVQEMDGVGRFGWVVDPVGTRIELWQPAE